MTHPIEASALRIGMFVHLNVGWMSHPFPLSSFKITSAEQIETIRARGLARMTWSPERSDPEAVGDAGTGGAPGPGAALAGVPATEAAQAHEAAAAPGRAGGARAAVALQRDTALRCERQFNEACRDLRRATDKVGTDPAGAGRDRPR